MREKISKNSYFDFEFYIAISIIMFSFIFMWIYIPDLASYRDLKLIEKKNVEMQKLKEHEVLSNELFNLIGESVGHYTHDTKRYYMTLKMKDNKDDQKVLLESKYEDLSSNGFIYQHKINHRILCIGNKVDKKCYYGRVI